MMKIETHRGIDRSLCGVPLELGPGSARVQLETSPAMAADDRGLVHGGFVFGLADYAAMLAVNDRHVVLGGAEVRFSRPSRVGEVLEADARLVEERGKKRSVEVVVRRQDVEIFSGRFACFVLDQHVLDAG